MVGQPVAAHGGGPSLLVLRQDMHIGSHWMAEQLSTQNLSVFFQFKGRCRGSTENPTDALLRLLSTGCNCVGHRGLRARVEAYCSGQCKDPQNCQGVAVIDGLYHELIRDVVINRSHYSDAAVSVITLGRDSFVKTAVSHLKDRCGTKTSLANHLDAGEANASRALQTPTFLHVEPSLLAAQAHNSARNHKEFANNVNRLLQRAGSAPAAHHASYEEFQLDAPAALRRLMHAVSLQYIPRSTAASAIPVHRGAGSTLKTSSEDLSELLLNFGDLEANWAIPGYPRSAACLRAQLLSPTVQNSSTWSRECGSLTVHDFPALDREPPLAGGSMLLLCEHRRCRLPLAPDREANRIGFEGCFAAKDRFAGDHLCALASEKLRSKRKGNAAALTQAEPPVHVCVRTLMPGGGDAHTPILPWLQNWRTSTNLHARRQRVHWEHR